MEMFANGRSRFKLAGFFPYDEGKLYAQLPHVPIFWL